MRTRFMIAFFVLSAAITGAQAQTPVQKIGYADWEYIFSQLPDYKQIETELKTHQEQLTSQAKAKQAEFESKLKAYNNMPATTPDVVKADKERELQLLQESYTKFQQDANTSLQNKQATLMQPVFEKVGKAIEDVAKAEGYSFIINPQLTGGGDILLYSDEKFNISNLVLKKLGVTPKEPQAGVNK